MGQAGVVGYISCCVRKVLVFGLAKYWKYKFKSPKLLFWLGFFLLFFLFFFPPIFCLDKFSVTTGQMDLKFRDVIDMDMKF